MVMSSDSKLLDFELLDYSKLFFQRPGLPGGTRFRLFILSLSVFTYLSFLSFLSLSFPLSLSLFLSFSISISDSDFTYQALDISNFNCVNIFFFFQIEKVVLKSLKLMLDYSKHLLELSSIQKFEKMSEYRVLDTRPWNH